KDYVTAAASYEKLVAAVEAMEKAKENFRVFKVAFDAVLNGEDKSARAKGTTPAPLATIRNTALDKLKQAAKDMGDNGKLPPATKKVADWKVEAKGWLDGWDQAKEAQTTLAAPPPDENKIKALAAKPGGGKVIDELVRNLGPKPSRAVLKTVMKVRFGVDLD